jgi:hypothetical protein
MEVEIKGGNAVVLSTITDRSPGGTLYAISMNSTIAVMGL